jgi:hypothetical protein
MMQREIHWGPWAPFSGRDGYDRPRWRRTAPTGESALATRPYAAGKWTCQIIGRTCALVVEVRGAHSRGQAFAAAMTAARMLPRGNGR